MTVLWNLEDMGEAFIHQGLPVHMVKQFEQSLTVFAWEIDNGLICNAYDLPLMSLTECRILVERVWQDYYHDVGPPKVVRGKGHYATGSLDVIRLPKWGKRPITVLHEVTHAILQMWTARRCLPEVEPHGPEFVRLYIGLLARYWKPPLRRQLLRTAAERGVEMAPRPMINRRRRQ